MACDLHSRSKSDAFAFRPPSPLRENASSPCEALESALRSWLSSTPSNEPSDTSSIASGAVNVPSSGEPEQVSIRHGFAALDDAAITIDPRVLVVVARNEAHGPLLAHVARRLSAAGCRAIEAAARAPTSLFREVATQLGLGPLPCNVTDYATALATASRPRLAVVSSLPREGSFDEAVARKLAERRAAVMVFVSASTPPDWATEVFEVGPELAPSDKLRWLMAIAQESESLLRGHDLRALHGRWRGARRRLRDARLGGESGAPDGTSGLSAAALEVVTCVALARRSLPHTAGGVAPLAGVLDELVRANVIIPSPHAIVLDPSVDSAHLEAAASPEARASTIRMLLGETGAFELDPWALARAAELLLPTCPEDADDALDRAGRLARDSRIVADITDSWFAAVEATEDPLRLSLRLRAAERALEAGKPRDALRWCESIGDVESPRARFLMARTLAKLGDLVGARLLLDRIPMADVDDELGAAITIERGELSYLSGDFAAALAEVESALERATSPRTRFAARGVQGKVLLARGDWAAADAHFAAETLDAQSAGETTAELRARLNRGIVQCGMGLLDEARHTFLDVLEDAERFGELRATAFALSNLGVVAYRKRDYVGALRYWEETIRQWDALGARIEGVHPLTNLAELRLRLGLVDNAEHAVLFAQKILSGDRGPAPAAQLRLVAAQVALARGSTELARDELECAMVHARATGNVEYIGAAGLVGARIALADGDVRQAEAFITIATENAKSARAVAELAILRVAHSRALGRPALSIARQALALARAAAEDDLLIDVHALVAACSRDEGDLEAARSHCARAVSIRDRIAGALPADVRDAFHSKPESRELTLLQQSLAETNAVPSAGREPESSSSAPPSAPPSGSTRSPTDELVGADERMRNLAVAIRKAAASDTTVLILGESGTGKELVARALHAASQRASRRLVVVNCAALLDTLLLSELFGHEKGAFTGATARRRGRFELAQGGTLFLDEIGDISPKAQVALLRVLQEGTFERIGGTTTLRTDTRVICATHRDLRTLVKRGAFREDLYYRIRKLTLEVPPLRARVSDIPLLARHLLARVASEQGQKPKLLSRDALEILQRHTWPGNVRELENVLRAAAVFAEGDMITCSDLDAASGDLRVAPAPPSGATIAGAPTANAPARPASEVSLTAVAYAHVRERGVSLHDMKRELERECVTRALEESGGNITRAAGLLGMKRPRVSQLAKQYRLTASVSEEDE